MGKNSKFKDEIYKIVKYQTKLASSKNKESSDFYEKKLGEHIKNMKMIGGESILSAMNDSSFSSHDKSHNSSSPPNDKEDATDKLPEFQQTKFESLLKNILALNNEIEESKRKLESCTEKLNEKKKLDEEVKIKKLEDVKDQESLYNFA